VRLRVYEQTHILRTASSQIAEVFVKTQHLKFPQLQYVPYINKSKTLIIHLIEFFSIIVYKIGF
jgi:hypothetical protein